jgi:hypothetical protein
VVVAKRKMHKNNKRSLLENEFSEADLKGINLL